MAISTVSTITPPPAKKPLWKNLTVQVLLAIVIGILYGHYFPESASGLKFLGDAFIKLIKMVIGPIVFLTVVIGISGMGDMKKVGKVGAKAIIYFEIVTTFALILGMTAANLLKPGAGLNMSAIEKADISKYTEAAKHQSTLDFVLHIIPENMVGAFAKGELLQILFIAILFGAALAATGEKGKPVEALLERITAAFFGIISIIMYAAPIGAFGAIAYTIGTYGIHSLLPLGKLIFDMLLAMSIFIFCVLGLICRWYGFSLIQFIRYIKEEMLIVLGTSSSESVLPNMMEKLQKLGCSKPVVGLVIPTGYSFNLDGTSIYLSMAVIFIAQAFNIELTLGQELGILGVLLLTSKGAAGVTGAGFITLAATLSATHSLPVEGLALLIGIDRFMSTARAITNLIGNGIATVVVAKMEKEFNQEEALTTYREYFKDPSISKI